MANYNFEPLVNYVRINYLNKMLGSKYKYIKGLYENTNPKEFREQNNNDWDIDHTYIKQIDKITSSKGETLKEKSSLPNKYKLEPISKFTNIENRFATKLNNAYTRNYNTIQNVNNKTDYLTTVLDNMGKDGRVFEKSYYIPYYYKNTNKVASYHDYADYLSMLYNVDLRLASWNNTIKDCIILGKDLVIIESHPNACPVCNEHSGKIYSVSGKSDRYESLEFAVGDGVGHPNCKCQLNIYWDDSQLTNQEIVKTNYYEDLQKARGYERKIKETQNEQDCYAVIDNLDKVGEISLKLDKIKDAYRLFLTEHEEIAIYLETENNHFTELLF